MATNKELEAKVSELKAVIADQEAQIESLKATPVGTSNQDERFATLEAEIAAQVTLIAEKDATIAQLEKGVKVVEVPQNTVPGKYKSELHGVTVKFKTGFVKMRTPEGLVESKEIMKNKGGQWSDFMDNLIGIGFGGFEIVQ